MLFLLPLQKSASGSNPFTLFLPVVLVSSTQKAVLEDSISSIGNLFPPLVPPPVLRREFVAQMAMTSVPGSHQAKGNRAVERGALIFTAWGACTYGTPCIPAGMKPGVTLLESSTKVGFFYFCVREG